VAGTDVNTFDRLGRTLSTATPRPTPSSSWILREVADRGA
jgi:hypothetical protein